MKTKIVTNNIPAGNWEDKYTTRNPIGRFFMDNFIHTIKQMVTRYKHEIKSITEVGCGEGNMTHEINSILPDISIKGCDLSGEIIALAKNRFPAISFYVKSIYDIGADDSADLIVCCEVLEHLEFPEKALKKMNSITRNYCLLSVPNEPLWRLLNMARGKYLRDLGNTPGHIQHWSSRGFIKLIQSHMNVIDVQSAIPWTIVLCKKK